jgi:uncharacterized protein (DUF1684 family)
MIRSKSGALAMTSKITLVVGLIIILLGGSIEGTGNGPARTLLEGSYVEEILRWREKRVEELTSADGWLSLVGLFWLKEGRNRFGSDRSNDIVLPRNRAPRFAGSLFLNGGVVRLEAEPRAGLTSNGAPVTSLVLESDVDGKQTVLNIGSLTLYLIKRGNKLGLRVKDSQNPARFHFAGLAYFPVNPKWRLEAKYEPHNPPEMIRVANVLGMVEQMVSPGTLRFEIAGKSYEIEPVVEKGETQLFIIFSDETAGKETYGAGRYLYADPPGPDGKVILDFNKSYNPPCAFTKFATCPLPPRRNRLPFRVEAGEKKYAAAGH